jgi:hypothetical protein
LLCMGPEWPVFRHKGSHSCNKFSSPHIAPLRRRKYSIRSQDNFAKKA